MAVSRRDHLVETALRLFGRDGFHATGIDRVLRESGVAKKTLYNHFRSKDDLIVAALQRRDRAFMAKLRATIARLAPQQEGDPRMGPVLAFFDGLDEWFHSEGFNGCTFINASAEYPRRDCPIHRACAAHKQLLRRVLQDLVADAGLSDAGLVAGQLALLADGAIVSAHTGSDADAAKVAKAAARQLLEARL